MTTAARPTFDTAKGGRSVNDRGINKLSIQVSSRDLPAHKTLKERLHGQDTVDELKERDLKGELEERERIAQIERDQGPKYRFVPSLEQAAQARLALKAERDSERAKIKDMLLSSESIIAESELAPSIGGGSIAFVNARKMAQLDKDEDFGSDSDLSESDFDDDDDDDDDPEELMAELNRIKQERQAEEERRERELRCKEDRIRETPATTNDDMSSNFSVKRRWDDDVPFKNCARDEVDPKRKLYVNDTLRQEFHKRFMDKYIR